MAFILSFILVFGGLYIWSKNDSAKEDLKLKNETIEQLEKRETSIKKITDKLGLDRTIIIKWEDCTLPRRVDTVKVEEFLTIIADDSKKILAIFKGISDSDNYIIHYSDFLGYKSRYSAGRSVSQSNTTSAIVGGLSQDQRVLLPEHQAVE